MLYTDNNKVGKFNVAKIKIKILNNNSKDNSISIKNIELYNKDFMREDVEDIVFAFRK